MTNVEVENFSRFFHLRCKETHRSDGRVTACAVNEKTWSISGSAKNFVVGVKNSYLQRVGQFCLDRSHYLLMRFDLIQPRYR